MVDNTNLGFLSMDISDNLIIYMYQPESRDSFGGQKLLRKPDYYICQKVNVMFRIQCNNSLIGQWNCGNDTKHTTFFATLDGGLGYCVSKKIGTKISEIYSDLLEIEYMTSSF
ncbi:hypothetical protein HA402_002578 [Bradysia odoriphaga]|nr:hypothetical protein HA402_002578 [Bradysia odoriphaga]